MDFTEFLVKLGRDAAARAEYDADPVGYVNRSPLSSETKRKLLDSPPTAADINQEVARSTPEQTVAGNFSRDGAGNVKRSILVDPNTSNGSERA